jgi:hypothetical protein
MQLARTLTRNRISLTLALSIRGNVAVSQSIKSPRRKFTRFPSADVERKPRWMVETPQVEHYSAYVAGFDLLNATIMAEPVVNGPELIWFAGNYDGCKIPAFERAGDREASELSTAVVCVDGILQVKFESGV